jgi:hypothetical protein
MTHHLMMFHHCTRVREDHQLLLLLQIARSRAFWNVEASCKKCHVLGIELHMKIKVTECLPKRHRSPAAYVYEVTQSAVEW